MAAGLVGRSSQRYVGENELATSWAHILPEGSLGCLLDCLLVDFLPRNSLPSCAGRASTLRSRISRTGAIERRLAWERAGGRRVAREKAAVSSCEHSRAQAPRNREDLKAYGLVWAHRGSLGLVGPAAYVGEAGGSRGPSAMAATPA